MNNVKSNINSHKNILKKKIGKTNQKKCNCQKSKKALCPLNGTCVISNVIYEASVITASTVKRYVGSTGGEFKKRWYGHMSDIRDITERRKDSPSTSTELSKYIQKLFNEKEKYEIKWKILRKIRQTDETIQKICTTCNLERLEIALANRKELLNRRSELVGKCVHYQRCYF